MAELLLHHLPPVRFYGLGEAVVETGLGRWSSFLRLVEDREETIASLATRAGRKRSLAANTEVASFYLELRFRLLL